LSKKQVRVWLAIVVYVAALMSSVRGQLMTTTECREDVCTVDGWVPRGSTIDGEGSNDRAGWSAMELSSRGDVVAIGA
jgi:hypothetical protein